MITEESLQGGEHGVALFARGGDVATKGGKCVSALEAAKAARHILLDFAHAQIAFG